MMINFLQLATPQEREKIRQVQELYAKLDREIDEFQKATALRCEAGCGRCCENPDIEITALEVLPLAYELWQTDKAQAVLDRLSDQGDNSLCVFYQPHPLNAGHGRCSVYEYRPLICRLFGFSVKTNKHGKAELVTCSTMKKLCATECAQIPEDIAAGLKAPHMQDYSMQVFNIDPLWAKEQLPMNEAVRQALEKVGMLKLKDKL